VLADAPLEVFGQREEMWCVVAAALALDVARRRRRARVLVLGDFPRFGRQHNRGGTCNGRAPAASRPHLHVMLLYLS
jgi:hypothetical protein